MLYFYLDHSQVQDRTQAANVCNRAFRRVCPEAKRFRALIDISYADLLAEGADVSDALLQSGMDEENGLLWLLLDVLRFRVETLEICLVYATDDGGAAFVKRRRPREERLEPQMQNYFALLLSSVTGAELCQLF
jgi:hypothetical protein